VFVLLAQSTAEQQGTASATFHHFHFRVGDPAAAMNEGAARLNGTRVLLRGLGVGVRVGGLYALFDRVDASESSPTRAATPEAAYSAAATWLRSAGVDITKEEPRGGASRVALADLYASEVLDHVGFAASNLSAAVAVLRAHGASPVRETADSALFQPADAPRIEILRDLDAPDAFWCPMHPDVRSSASGQCPICGMALVPIPPPRLGEYRMDLGMTAASGGGISRLRITLREPDTDRRVTSLATIHERLLHLFVVDRSLQFFRHVHPNLMSDGTFELRETIPPGEYVVIADFLPQGGVSQMVQRAIVTPGHKGALFPVSPDLSNDTATNRIVDGIRVQLEPRDLKAGREGVLRFTLSDAASGAPVTDLEPFLGAPGHLLIVNADLTEADHVHPEEPVARGPAITFQPLLPAGGFYKLWLQFQRRGVVTTVPFVVAVEER
jgi:hypothetical protein